MGGAGRAQLGPAILAAATSADALPLRALRGRRARLAGERDAGRVGAGERVGTGVEIAGVGAAYRAEVLFRLGIDPHLPDGWGEVRVTRRFRGTEYRIALHAGTGRVQRLTVDGVPVEGNVVPLPGESGTVVEVEAFREAPAEAVP